MMKKIDWTTFTQRIAVKTAMQTMYNAFTKATELERWFLKQALYADPEGHVTSRQTPACTGWTYEWQWYLHNDVEKGHINQANGKNHLQFTFAGNCLVDVNLTTHNGHTIVELTQKNIAADAGSRRDIYLSCSLGWAFYLVNLKSVYEGGIDLRGKDESLPPMINN